MKTTIYEIKASLAGIFCELEYEEMIDRLEDIGAGVERDKEDGIIITYEAGGNVDAVVHVSTLLIVIQDMRLEADTIIITGRKMGER